MIWMPMTFIFKRKAWMFFFEAGTSEKYYLKQLKLAE